MGIHIYQALKRDTEICGIANSFPLAWLGWQATKNTQPIMQKHKPLPWTGQLSQLAAHLEEKNPVSFTTSTLSTSGALHQGNTGSQSNPAKGHRERVVIRWQYVLYKSTFPVCPAGTRHVTGQAVRYGEDQITDLQRWLFSISGLQWVWGNIWIRAPLQSSNLRHKNTGSCRLWENESTAPFYSINL